PSRLIAAGRLARPVAFLLTALAPEVLAPRLASNLAKASGSRAAGGRIDGSTSLNTPARASTKTARVSRSREPREELKMPALTHGPIRKNRIALRRMRLLL